MVKASLYSIFLLPLGVERWRTEKGMASAYKAESERFHQECELSGQLMRQKILERNKGDRHDNYQ